MFHSPTSVWLQLKSRLQATFAFCRPSSLTAAWQRIVPANKRRRGRRSRHWIDGWWSTVHQTRQRRTYRLGLEQLETRCVLDVGLTGGGAIVLQDNCAITFSETSPDLTVTGWTINWGDGTVETLDGSVGGSSHAYAALGSYSASATADTLDPDLNSGTDSAAVSVDVIAPPPPNNVVVTSDQSSCTEGTTVNYSAGYSDAYPNLSNFTLAWVVKDANGNPVTSGSGTTFSFTPALKGTYTISCSVADSFSQSASGSTGLSVVDRPPTISGLPNATINEGSAVAFTGSVGDPDAEDNGLSVSADWKDGSAIETIALSGGNFSTSHIYADDGTYTPVLTVTSGAVSASASATVTVNNVAPTLTIGGNASASMGDVYALNLSSSDPGNDTVTSWLINWGDGTPPDTVPGNPTQWTHVFGVVGNFTISAEATDEDGTWDAANTQTVSVSPIYVSISSDLSQAEGNDGTTPFNFTVALSQASSQTVTVQVATADNTATVADNDYQAVSQTVTFAPGETSHQVTVNVTGDHKIEPDEVFQISLSNPSYAQISYSVVMGTIVNDDYAPVANDDNYDDYYSAANGFVLNVNAANGVLANDTSNGGTLTVNDYTQPANGSVTVNSDGSFQYTPNEGFTADTDSFTYQATNGSNQNSWATVTIQVHAGAHFSVGDVTVLNADVSATFTVTYTPPETPSGTAYYDPMTVQWSTTDGTAVAGTDYQSSSGTLTFYYGDGPKTVQVPIIATDNTADQKTFYVAAGTSGSQGTGTIVNGDLDILDGNGAGIPEDQELDPGGIVMQHVTGEDDMTRMVIHAVAGSIGGMFRLQFDSSYFNVWQDSSATNAVVSDVTEFDPTQSTTVYVAAVPQTQDGVDDQPWSSPITLAWADPQTQSRKKADKVKENSTVVGFSVATIISGNQAGAELSNNLEKTDGAFVPVNDDDDNYDKTPDLQNTGAIAGESDLLPIYIKAIGSDTPNNPYIALSTYLLSIPSNVRVWRNADRSGAEVTDGTEFNANLSGETNVQNGVLTLYAEGVAEGVGTLNLKWIRGQDGELFDKIKGTQIKVTTFGFHGPQNVPNYSTYTYYVTGAGNATPANAWSVPAGGTLAGQQTASSTDVKWGNGGMAGEVGKVEFAASLNYKWDRQVNVVKISITDGTPSFAPTPELLNFPFVVPTQANDPTNGAAAKVFTSINGANPGLLWTANVKLEGPQGHGVDRIVVGYQQLMTYFLVKGNYSDGTSLTLVPSEGEINPLNPYRDDSPGSTGVWYSIRDTAMYNGPNLDDAATGSSAKPLVARDSPRGGIPVTAEMRTMAQGFAGATLLTSIDVQEDFSLDIAAQSKDDPNFDANGLSAISTRLATTDWDYNNSGSIGPNGTGANITDFVYERSPSARVSVANAWQLLTDGSRPTPMPSTLAIDVIRAGSFQNF
jgi:hypothetical protein